MFLTAKFIHILCFQFYGLYPIDFLIRASLYSSAVDCCLLKQTRNVVDSFGWTLFCDHFFPVPSPFPPSRVTLVLCNCVLSFYYIAVWSAALFQSPMARSPLSMLERSFGSEAVAGVLRNCRSEHGYAIAW